MTLPTSTICPHNAEGQTLLPGAPVHCRMCGAFLEAPVGSNGAAGTPPAAAIAEYPGESTIEERE